MAYIGYCENCHHLHATVRYFDLLEYFIDHSVRCHKGDERFYIMRISAKEFQDYLKNRGNPAFWKAWRLAKKSLFFDRVAGRKKPFL